MAIGRGKALKDITATCNGARFVPENWEGPAPLPAGCGREFTVSIPEGEPSETATWDVTTDADGKVTERHSDVTCPFCGTITWVREKEATGART